MNLKEHILSQLPWEPVEVIEQIPHGDMPGDKVNISEEHIAKAKLVFPELLEKITSMKEMNLSERVVISVYGGSGVGKSEIASLLSYYFQNIGVGSYTLSGDNYPRRIPMYNDAERVRIFRQSGVRGIVSSGKYTQERFQILQELQINDIDAKVDMRNEYPWLEVYQIAGRKGLKSYLGTENEIDFVEVDNIVSQFKNGADTIYLKRMGRDDTELWYEKVDFSEINILVIEWTHGNNNQLQGVDLPIFLNSTPKETLAHRKMRNRDGAIDSPFTTMVLELEQELLCSQTPNAKIILSKSGEKLSFEQYKALMME